MSINTTYNTQFTAREPLSMEEYERRKETAEKVATGTAAGGTAAYQAKKYVSKKYVRGMFENVTGTARTVSQNAREATSLWTKFKLNTVKFTKDAMTRLMKFQNNKYLGPIIKSKAVKGLTAGFGTAMAFFVLVTGVGEAIEDGRLALSDVKRKMSY